MKRTEWDMRATNIEFKIISDIDGSAESYGYLLSNSELDFYDFYLGEEKLINLVNMGLEPLKIFDTLTKWYPELKDSLKEHGVILNGEYIPYGGGSNG